MNDAAREFVLAPSGSASEALGKVPKCYVPTYVQEQHERELKTRWRINNTQSKKDGGTERRIWKQDMKVEPSTANANSTLRLTEDKLVRPNSVLLSNLSVSAKEKEDKHYKEVELRALRDRLRFKQKGASQRGGSGGSSFGGQGGSSSPPGRLGSPFGPFLNATVLDANDAGARERRAAGWLEKKSKASRHAPILIQSTKLYGGLQKAWRSGDVQHTPFSTLTPASGTVDDIHRPVLVDAPSTSPGTPSSPNPHLNITTSPGVRRQLVLDQQLQDPRIDLDGECSSSSEDGHRKAQATKKVTCVKKNSPSTGKVNNGGGSSSDDETTAADNKAKARAMLSFDMEQIGGGQFAQVGRIAPSASGTHPPNQASRDISNSKMSKRRAERKMQKDLRRFEAHNPNVIMPSLRDQMSRLAFSSPASANKGVDSPASLDIPSLGSLPSPQDSDLKRRASSSHLSREAAVAQSPQRVIDRLVFEDSSDEEYFVDTINKERDRLERKMDSQSATNTKRMGLSARPTHNVPPHLKPIDHGNAPLLLQSNGLMQQKSHDQIAKDLALRATTYFPESDLQRLAEETERLRGQNSLPRTGSTVAGGIRRVESSAQLVRRVSGLGQFLSNPDDQSPPKGQKSVNFVNSINPSGSSPATNSLLLGDSTPTSNIGGVGGILKQQPILSDVATVDTPTGSHTVSPNASFSLRPQQSLRFKAQVNTRGPSPAPHGGPVSLDPSDASSILRELYYVSCPTHEDREGAYVSALGGLSFNMDFPKFKKLVRGLIPHPTSSASHHRGGSSSPNNGSSGSGGCQHYQPISDDVALSMFAVIIENSSHLQQSAHTFLPQGGHGGQRNGSQQQGGNLSAMMEASVEEIPVSNNNTSSPTKLAPSMSPPTASSPFGHRQLQSGLSANSTLPPALQVTITYVRFLSGLCQSVLSPAQLKFVDSLYVAVVNSPHVGYYLYHLKYQVVHRMRAKLEILRQHRAALQQAMQNEMDAHDNTTTTTANSAHTFGKRGGVVDVFSSATSIPTKMLDGFDPENWLLIGSLGDRMPIPSSALSAPKGGGANGNGAGNGRIPGEGASGWNNNDTLVDTPRRSRLQRTNSVASSNSRISSVNGASPSHHTLSSRPRLDNGSPSKRSPRKGGGRVAELNYAQMFQDRLRSEVSKLMTLASSLEFTLIGDPLGDTLRVKSYFITRRRNRERVQHLLHEQQQQQRRVALEQLSRKQQEHRKKQMRKQHRHGDDDDDDDDDENGLEAELLALMEESMINIDISKGSGGNADDESLNLLALAGGVHDELLGGPDCVALQRSAPSIPALTKLGAVFVPPTAMTTPGSPSPSSKRLAPIAGATPGGSPAPGGGYYGSLAAKPPAEAALVNYFRYRKETDIISDVITTLETQLDLIKTRSAMVSGRPGSGGGSPGAAGAGGGGGGLQGGLYTVAAMDDVFRAPQNGVSRVGNGGSRSVATGLYQPFTPGEDVSRPDLLLSLFLPGAPPKPSSDASSSSAPSSSSAGQKVAQDGQSSSPKAGSGGGRRDSMMVTSMSYDETLLDSASSTHATESPLATLSVARPGVKFATFVVRDAVFNLKGVSMQFPHPEEDAFVAAVMNCLCDAAIDTSANLLQDQLNVRTTERECEEAEEKALVALEAALRSSLIGEDIAARDGPQASSTHSPIRHHSGGGTFGSRSVMSENESQNSHSTQSRGGGGGLTPLQKVRLSGKGTRPVSLSNRPPTSTMSSSPTTSRKRIGTASSVGTGVTGRASISSLPQMMTTQGHHTAVGGKSNTMGGGGVNHQGNPWAGQSLSEKSKHYNTSIYEAAPLAPPPLAHLSLDDFRMLLFCDNDVMNALSKIVPAGTSPVSGIFGPPPSAM